MSSIKAIIFDLDNTILDRTSTFKQFTVSFLNNYFSHMEDHQGIHERMIELDQDGYKDKNVLFHELLEELPWNVKPEHDELLQFYRNEYVKSAVLMEQALEVIRYLRKKYKTALITNGRNEIQYGKIDRMDIRDEFDFIIVSEEAGCKKPDSRIFEAAINNLQLQPKQCIYVGDHPVNDIEGASKAGMDTVWIKVNQPWRDGLSVKPLHTIERLNELLAIF
jgi:putative hydrolase of the HAD superfamily